MVAVKVIAPKNGADNNPIRIVESISILTFLSMIIDDATNINVNNTNQLKNMTMMFELV